MFCLELSMFFMMSIRYLETAGAVINEATGLMASICLCNLNNQYNCEGGD